MWGVSELYFRLKKCNEKEIKRECVSVFCFMHAIFFLCYYGEKRNIKKMCVFFVNGQINVFQKFILDLITSLLNLTNLAKSNRKKINSWELTINFR